MAFLESSTHAYQSKLYSEFAARLRPGLRAHFLPAHRGGDPRPQHPRRPPRCWSSACGTGLALDAYPPHCQVTGVDLAPDMLEHAQERIDQNGWRHITLHEMDAMNLKLPDNSFDYVMAFHVVSVVPDATRMMREAQRVCKPGGQIVVINHFRSRNRLLAALDRGLEPITRRWGWHTLDRGEVFDGLPVELERVYKTSRRSLFTIVVARNRKAPPAAVSAAI